MTVLVLGHNCTAITAIVKECGDTTAECSDHVDTVCLRDNKIDFIISYGYRHIIGKPVIDFLKDRIINLHISLLPWNRGADPNLWSFLEDTPKGVSIHYIDEGIDTGDIIVQKPITFERDGETLATTYQKLQDQMIQLFAESWPTIKQLRHGRYRQNGVGSYHRSSDKARYQHLLTEGWNTPINSLVGRGIVK